MPAAFPRLSSAGLSEQGYVRPNNEDRIHCDDTRGIYVVVDGMGGHAAGEQAATLALERIRARLERATDSPEQRLREAIALANNAIYEAAQVNPEWRGMACVLTAAVIADGQISVGHVGDSRLYKIRRGHIQKMTRDHSPVGQREDAGEISEHEAMHHPRRNEVYRDVGSKLHAPDDPDFIDTLQFAFEPDSAILLCSDGLSDVTSSDEILETVETHAQDPQAAVQSLVAAATRVGHDNVSAIFVEGEGFARIKARARKTGGSRDGQDDRDRTDRLSISSTRTHQHRWYGGRAAWFACGLLVGALVLFAARQESWIRPARTLPPKTISVTSPASISQALSSASAGDTVVLSPGTYVEVVHLKGGVNLVSEKLREAVIEGSIIAENVAFGRVDGVQVRSSDFGIVVRDSNVTISNTEVSGAKEAGIEFLGGSRGAVNGCSIHDNAGPGLMLLDTAEPAIRNNVITGNGMAPGRLRPGVFIRSTASSTVSGNIIAGNGSQGIWLQHDDPDLLQHNAFSFGEGGEKGPLLRIVSSEAKQP